MALAELLTVLPEDHPGRDKVLHLFRSHIRGIAEVQDGTGLWHNMLDRENTYLETSASAMFVFAVARGINEGWIAPLDGPVAFTGWNGVASRVLPGGRISGICEGTTYANDMVDYVHRGAGEYTTFFGAVLRAGGEMIRLLDNPAFLHTIVTGLRSMESPDWGGWGGRYVRVRENTWLDPVPVAGYAYPEGRWYTSSAWGRNSLRDGTTTTAEQRREYFKPMWRWTDLMQNDFAARADWCVKPFAQANHAPVVTLGHATDSEVKPGATVKLRPSTK